MVDLLNVSQKTQKMRKPGGDKCVSKRSVTILVPKKTLASS